MWKQNRSIRQRRMDSGDIDMKKLKDLDKGDWALLIAMGVVTIFLLCMFKVI